MPRVRISSMYDLNTNTKFGIIGVHTPTASQLQYRYDGLLRNYRFMKVKSCSVKIACASLLPVDPLQVGVSAGKISPADIMNPILYKAVSNESWNTILNRIYNPVWSADAAQGIDDAFPGASEAVSDQVYYSLLSGNDWRKVMPQQGLSVKGLKPLVHEVVSVFGQQYDPKPAQPADDLTVGTAGATGLPTAGGDQNVVFRGRTLPMPAIPTAVIQTDSNPMSVKTTPNIPKTMVLAVIMPPSKLQAMYFRMIVSWDIVFFGLRSSTELDFTRASADGSYARYSRWSIASSKSLESVGENEAKEIGTIDTLNMSPELVMES